MLFNEPKLLKSRSENDANRLTKVSVLFNEPKLLKSFRARVRNRRRCGFSALQRAEIAEISAVMFALKNRKRFQCSSTSRNC